MTSTGCMHCLACASSGGRRQFCHACAVAAAVDGDN
eukprot:CAMPEP_0175412792 /NCGR_PEP_ID=MMETSP0095-20121207/42820_1 /TAXON_ID=311494 /ORGANISM="Alexandrium monilatum, Strain CCMP3105" /LENGTH=35 /DNA_ID= /DNA_START= /DNA_END= /DNA_ORIENTATION=